MTFLGQKGSGSWRYIGVVIVSTYLISGCSRLLDFHIVRLLMCALILCYPVIKWVWSDISIWLINILLSISTSIIYSLFIVYLTLFVAFILTLFLCILCSCLHSVWAYLFPRICSFSSYYHQLILDTVTMFHFLLLSTILFTQSSTVGSNGETLQEMSKKAITTFLTTNKLFHMNETQLVLEGKVKRARHGRTGWVWR